MKLSLKTIGWYSLIILLTSCSGKERTGRDEIGFPKTILLNLSETQDSFNLSEIAEKVEYIPLETTDKAPLGYFWDFAVANDFIFIKNESDIMVYDKNGKFIKNLFTVGNGPGEAFAYCFTVDKDGQSVYVYDHRKKDVKIYSYTGVYVRTIKKPIAPGEYVVYAIGFFNNNLLVHTTQRPFVKYLYSCFDLQNDSIHVLCWNYRNYDKSQEGRNSMAPYDYHFQITDSTILYKETFCDTVFEVNSNFKQMPRYIIDLGNKKLEWTDWRDYGMFNFSGNSLPSGYKIQSFLESENFLFMVLRSIMEPQELAVYDKRKNSLRKIRNNNIDRPSGQVFINNDLDNLIPFSLMNQTGHIFYFDGCLYSVIEAKDFEKYYRSASLKVQTSTEYLRDMAQAFTKITEFSNPVIMKIYLK